MSWFSVFAVYFILWWVVLFATLPFSLKTQDDEQDVTLGTVSSAPKGPHVRAGRRSRPSPGTAPRRMPST